MRLAEEAPEAEDRSESEYDSRGEEVKGSFKKKKKSLARKKKKKMVESDNDEDEQPPKKHLVAKDFLNHKHSLAK